jgi:hypothetical protein
MRITVIAFAAVLLAGCGGLVQIDEGNGTGSAGPDGRVAPAGPIRPARNTREGTIQACVADLGRSLPQGANVQALCECTVDRMIAGTGQMDAVRQCARDQNVTLPGQ